MTLACDVCQKSRWKEPEAIPGWLLWAFSITNVTQSTLEMQLLEISEGGQN